LFAINVLAVALMFTEFDGWYIGFALD
jgi:hypothetical protein